LRGLVVFHLKPGESMEQAAPLVCFTEPIAEAGATRWAAAADSGVNDAIIQDDLRQGGIACGSAQGIADLYLRHR